MVHAKIFLPANCFFPVGIPVLILYTTTEPFHRGFFCDDQSIQHPYTGDTVTDTGLALGVVTVTAIPVSMLGWHK